jgi:hypothetical protein
MNRLIRTRLAVLVAGTVGLSLLSGIRADDNAKPDPVKSAPAREAVTPKPLGESAKKGLEYLIKQQNANGGWGQGGGWRVGGQGIDGVEGLDPPDVGDTSIAVLALVRSGSTPKDGKYAKEVAKGVEFICTHVEKSDSQSLYVTDIKGTQIQSKIGPYVDTFLVSMVLAELKGKMADEKGDKMLMAALGKTIAKIEKNQQADGTFAGNNGWASVLSQGLANKGLNRAAQAGATVKGETLDRIQGQVAGNFDDKTKAFKSTGADTGLMSRVVDSKVGGRNSIGRGGSAPTATSPSDAGVSIYGNSSNLTNTADQVNTLRLAEKKAKDTLDSKSASKEEREKAEITLKKVEQAKYLCAESTKSVVKQLENPAFVQGFGSNGGEEFLSFMNISEALLLKGGDEWKKWDKAMSESLTRVQDRDGSWSGHHCITGKTFCTATALLVLMADRAPIPAGDPNSPPDYAKPGVIAK